MTNGGTQPGQGQVGGLVPGSARAYQHMIVRRLVLWLLIAVAFTALIIQYSYMHGKLLCPPFYDDVSYFEDALHRLNIFYRDGLGAVLKDYVRFPPHSPFSSFVAATAFALMGVHDWAPYVADGLIIVGLLAFLDYVAWDVGLVRRLALFLIVLTVPICGEAVYEFRPDIASALCAAIGVALLLWRSLTITDWKYRAVAGAMFGLALLFKPPTSPLTLAVFFAALGAAGAIDFVIYRPPLREIGMAWAQCTWPMVLIPLPHYLLTWADTVNYIYQPIFGPAHSVWARDMSLATSLKYYLTGEGGGLMLGLALWWLLAVIGAGMIGLLAMHRREQALRLGGMLCVGLVAYSITTYLDVKQQFFGTTFDLILIFSAVFILCVLLRARGWIPVALVVLVVFVSLREARFPPSQGRRGSDVVRDRNDVLNRIYDALMAERFPIYRRVYITSTGFVNAGVLDYYYRRDTLHALNIGEYSFSGDVKDHQRGMSLADYVIASESDNGLAFADFLQSGNVQDQTLSLVRHNPDFEQIASFLTRKSRHYFLFRRIRNFCGWDEPRGLAEVSGQKTGNLQWAYEATSPSTILTIPAGGTEDLRLVATVKTPSLGLTIRIKADKREIGHWVVERAGQFEEYTLPFTIHGGGTHELEIDYTALNNATPTMLFSRLEIIPDEMK
jgi:hypothetical protein